MFLLKMVLICIHFTSLTRMNFGGTFISFIVSNSYFMLNKNEIQIKNMDRNMTLYICMVIVFINLFTVPYFISFWYIDFFDSLTSFRNSTPLLLKFWFICGCLVFIIFVIIYLLQTVLRYILNLSMLKYFSHYPGSSTIFVTC